jgi:hypothetical protein
MNNKATLVIAAYKEDLSWLDNITNEDIDIVIINKGIHESHHKAKCITIKNVGVCDNSFCYYISEFYDQLSEYTIFSQGNPFDHYKNMLEFINNKSYEKTSLPKLGTYIGYKPLTDHYIYIPPKEGTDIFVEGMLDYKFNGINFPSGAQYCVCKKNIQSKPKKFWMDLFEYLDWEGNTFIAYFMERTWLLLYDDDININKEYLNSPYFFKYKNKFDE